MSPVGNEESGAWKCIKSFCFSEEAAKKEADRLKMSRRPHG